MKNFKLSNGITHIPLELPWTSPGFVNVYLIEDSDGYIMIDCGVNGEKYFSLLKNYLMEEKIELNDLGIDFLYYLPKNTFVVYLKENISDDIFEEYNIISVNKILPEYKLDKKLQNEPFPDWCVQDNFLHIKVIFFSNVDLNDCILKISDITNEVLSINENSKSLIISIAPQKTNLISDFEAILPQK